MSPMGAPGIVKERVQKICYAFDTEKKALVKMLSWAWTGVKSRVFIIINFSTVCSIEKSDTIYVSKQFRGERRGDKKLLDCQKSGYDSGRYARVVKVGTRRDISPTDGLLLEQLPTPYFPPLNYGGGGFFGSGSSPVSSCLWCMFLSFTHPRKAVLLYKRISLIRVCVNNILYIFFIAYHS